jgi:hypothetical protein
MARRKGAFRVKVHCYVLMENDFHLVATKHRQRSDF